MCHFSWNLRAFTSWNPQGLSRPVQGLLYLCCTNWATYAFSNAPYSSLESPVVIICTISLTFNNATFCPHSAFICFVWIWEQTAIIAIYSMNWLVFITETVCVYCAVRTGSLYTVQVNLSAWRFVLLLPIHEPQQLFSSTPLSSLLLFSPVLSSPLLPVPQTRSPVRKSSLSQLLLPSAFYPSVRQPPPENDSRGTLIYDINGAVLSFRHPGHDVWRHLSPLIKFVLHFEMFDCTEKLDKQSFRGPRFLTI